MPSARSTSCSSRSLERLARAGALGLTVAVLAACGSGQSRPAAGPRALSADSAALLRAALPLVRPGFATQGEALRAGVYSAERPALAVAPAPPPRPAPPPAADRHPAPAAPPPAALPATVEARPATGTQHEWVIQVAAYRDRRTAEAAAEAAGARFPELTAQLEAAGEMVRVTLTGWSAAAANDAVLRMVQQSFPDAWLRRVLP